MKLMNAVIICFAIMIAIGPIILMTKFMPQSEWCPMILSNTSRIDNPYYTNTILYNDSDHKKNLCHYCLISRNIINNDIYFRKMVSRVDAVSR